MQMIVTWSLLLMTSFPPLTQTTLFLRSTPKSSFPKYAGEGEYYQGDKNDENDEARVS